jgi:hypothetical protein
MIRVNVGPCHHGMACSVVVDVGDGLQIWTIEANILNKQSRTADKEWSSSVGGGRGANSSSQKKKIMKCYTVPRTWRAVVNTTVNFGVP